MIRKVVTATRLNRGTLPAAPNGRAQMRTSSKSWSGLPGSCTATSPTDPSLSANRHCLWTDFDSKS